MRSKFTNVRGFHGVYHIRPLFIHRILVPPKHSTHDNEGKMSTPLTPGLSYTSDGSRDELLGFSRTLD